MKINNQKNRISEYSFAEECLNVASHASGLVLSIIGLSALLIQANNHGTIMHTVSYAIFGSSLIALYLASTLFHSLSNTKFRSILQKIDHLAIYFLIAGTYTPIMLVGTKGSNGIRMLVIIWALAIFSCFMRLSNYKKLQNIAFLNYLVMGWLVVVIFDELMIHMSITSVYLLIIGGIFYTSGVIFYCWDKLPFNHSIWHLFVLGGSTSHFFSIYFLI